MNRRNFLSPSARLALAALVLSLFLAGPALAQDCKVGVVQPFQFSDEFLLDNGIDASLAVDHFVFPDAKPGFDRTRQDEPAPGCAYNDVRVIETTGGFKHNGNLLYYMAPSKVMPNTFTNDAAGDNARALANAYNAFLFPKANGDPLSPAPPNRRQDNIFETKNGYWSNNPLGLWRLNFVSYDGPNAGSPDCAGFKANQIARNGVDLDGTGVIRTTNEIEAGVREGCLRIRQRAEDGSQGFPWVV